MRELRQAIRKNRLEEYRNDFYRRREPDASETLVQDTVN
jgi:queuine/archaeosine tRNA-ribosyltransferase